MRHKVVLYNPKAVFHTMPLPIMAVASALDRQRFEPVILDGRFESHEELLNELEDALCLGISVLTGAPLADSLEVTRVVHQRFPDLPIVWGGWHPSLFPEMCIEEPGVKIVVNGQGEWAFCEIVDRLAAGEDLAFIAGTYTKQEAGPTRSMADVNALPPMDYSLIDVDRYYKAKGVRQLDYISSQGCRFRCNFCADPAVYKRGWSGLDPERMVAEVDELWQRFKFTDLGLQDETFFTRASRVEHIAKGFLRSGKRFTWTATMRADQGRRMDDELFALCAESGLRKVIIGMEAGSQKTIDWMQKDIKVEDMWATAEKLIAHGIAATINVIVGFPGESAESVAESLRVAQKLRAMSPSFHLAIFYFKPYPGNPIATSLELMGYRFPETLEEWSQFDYVGQGNQWLTPAQKAEIENFKFYQHYAYDFRNNLLKRPIQWLARQRVEKLGYGFPIEKYLIQKLRPPVVLS